MRVLAVSDEENPALWEHYQPGRLKDYDLILSCGDLKAAYLSFLVTMGRAPLLYVHGNHDESYLLEPPEGCDCIDDHLVVYRGLRILGLGGCLRYRPGATFQYTEREMARRIARLRLALLKSGGVDLVVTHAPPRGLGDQEDLPHQGFESLKKLLDRYHPQYFLHGHVHLRNAPSLSRERQYGETRLVNVWDRYILDLPDRPYAPRDAHRVRYITRHKDPGDDWDDMFTPPPQL